MTLESVIAKVMWMLGNREALGGNLEDIFYQNVNYDVILGKTGSVDRSIISRTAQREVICCEV